MRLRDKNLDTRQRSNSTIRLWDKIRFFLTTKDINEIEDQITIHFWSMKITCYTYNTLNDF